LTTARTTACVVGLIAAVGALAVSVWRVSADRARGAVREYVFACWGGASETNQLRRLVIDPINFRSGGFRIRLVQIPSDYHTKLSTMIAGGTPPDFFYLSQEYVPAFAAAGALLDLTDMIAADGDEVTDLGDYYPNVLEVCRRDGRLYGLPWIAQPVVLYCNAELFRRCGVALPDGRWDWDRFVDAARRLTRDTDGDGRIDQWGFIINGWPPYQMWVWQNGADVVDRRSGRLNFDDPRVTEAMDAYAGLIHRHGLAPPLSIVSETGFSEMFRAGRAAMFMGGAADDLDRIDGLEVVVAEVPTGPGGVRATFAWTAGLHISRSVHDPHAAFAVWKQILEAIHRWKIPAPRKSLAARLEEIEPRKAPAAAVIRASMEYMRTPAVFERQVQWDTIFWEEIEDELLRKGTPAEELIGRKIGILESLRE